jgi:hypothetical protein
VECKFTKEIAEELGYDLDYDFLVEEAEKFKLKHNILTCNINLGGEIDSLIIQLSFLVERTEEELTEAIRERKIASNAKRQRLREAREKVSF